jgi:hypothetical protein
MRHVAANVLGNDRRGKGRHPRGVLSAPGLEALEARCLLDGGGVYSITGVGNNLAHPNWGSVGQDLLRVAPAAYGDGVSSLAGPNRPSPRLISNVLATDTTDGGLPNNRSMSDYVYAWGQFIDHDIDLTTGGTGSQLQAANISVPFNPGDHFSTAAGGPGVIFFNRSEFDPKTGTSKSNPRQQINNITAFLDGSMIYGSDPVVADALRTHSGGKLKSSPGPDGVLGTQDDLLPYNNHTYFPGISLDPGDPAAAFSIANDAHLVADDQLFMAGDVRANENIELTAMHTLFLREHNRIAGQVASAFPFLSDEAVYQFARAVVIGEIQSITFNEFLPALLGPNVIPDYQGYDPTVNPGIATEFSTGGFRLGHSLLAPDVQFLNPDGTTKYPALSLANSFFNPPVLAANGADPILKYLASDNAQEIDNKIVPELQNFLFGPPGAGGFDLASLNIQRGRDHGLSDYNTTRAFYGLPKVTRFDQITSNPALQAKLQQLYGNVNNIDLWVGMLAEDHVPGGSVGPLVQRIVAKQFENLRDGDRLWFENQYSGAALSALENTTLQDIVQRNTVDDNLQDNVFLFKVSVSGTVYNDGNHNGRQDPGEQGLGGVTVLLKDDSGSLVATARTNANGFYQYTNLNGLGTGSYTVVLVLPSGSVSTTTNPVSVSISRGGVNKDVDFGVDRKSGPFVATGAATGSSGAAADSGSQPATDATAVSILVSQRQAPAATATASVGSPVTAQASASVASASDAGTGFNSTVVSAPTVQGSSQMVVQAPASGDPLLADALGATLAGDPLATDLPTTIG